MKRANDWLAHFRYLDTTSNCQKTTTRPTFRSFGKHFSDYYLLYLLFVLSLCKRSAQAQN